MIKGALFTIGILATFGGFAMAALAIFAAGMSDAPGAPSNAGPFAFVGCVGIAMIIGAIFIP